MTSYEQPHFNAETQPAASDTRLQFWRTLDDLVDRFPRHTTISRYSGIDQWLGDRDGYAARIECDLSARLVPEGPLPHASQAIQEYTDLAAALTIAYTPPDVTCDPFMDPEASGAVHRVFQYGSEVRGAMTDEQYASTMFCLSRSLPPDEWNWIQSLRRFTQGSYTAETRYPALQYLLDAAVRPPSIRMHQSTTTLIIGINFRNGSRCYFKQTASNQAFQAYRQTAYEDEDIPPSTELKLKLTTGEEYRYLAYTDGSEYLYRTVPMLLPEWQQHHALHAVLGTRTGSNIPTPHGDRQGQTFAPADRTMLELAKLLQKAITSGANPPSY